MCSAVLAQTVSGCANNKKAGPKAGFFAGWLA